MLSFMFLILTALVAFFVFPGFSFAPKSPDSTTPPSPADHLNDTLLSVYACYQPSDHKQPVSPLLCNDSFLKIREEPAQRWHRQFGPGGIRVPLAWRSPACVIVLCSSPRDSDEFTWGSVISAANLLMDVCRQWGLGGWIGVGSDKGFWVQVVGVPETRSSTAVSVAEETGYAGNTDLSKGVILH